MDHQECSFTKIYWTKDYSLFHFIAGNRDLIESKIKKLVHDAQNGLDLFKFCPILVNKNMAIIDGQHRFLACKQMKLNVYYVVVPDCTFAEIARLNNNQNRWKMTDFLNCYRDAGENSKDYNILAEFLKLWPVSFSTAIFVLMTGSIMPTRNRDVLEAFRNGDFKALRYENASELMVYAEQYAQFTSESYSREFLLCLQKLLASDQFSNVEMIEKLHKHDLKIIRQQNSKKYLFHMEELFNYKNSIRRRLY